MSAAGAYAADIQKHYVAEHTDGPFSYLLTLAVKEGEVAECLHGSKPHEATLRHFDVEDGPVPTHFCLPHFLRYLDDISRQAVQDVAQGNRVYTLLLSDDHLKGHIDTIVEGWVSLWEEASA